MYRISSAFLGAVALVGLVCFSSAYVRRVPPVQFDALVTSVDLTLDNWQKETSSGYWLIYFGTNWCEHCDMMMTQWNQLIYSVSSDPIYKIGYVDCDKEKNLCKREGVKAYPTVHLYNKGSFVAVFDGGRSAQIMDFWTRARINSVAVKAAPKDAVEETERVNKLIEEAEAEALERKESISTPVPGQWERRQALKANKEKKKLEAEEAVVKKAADMEKEQRMKEREQRRLERQKVREELAKKGEL